MTCIHLEKHTSAAGISRSTFYAHYDNLDQMFSALVFYQQASTRTLNEQLHCDACAKSDAALPFCAHIRSGGRHAAIVRDPHYLASFIGSLSGIPENDEYGKLKEQGLSDATTRALQLFQLSGCYTAASAIGSDAEWERAREAIDEFIRGGLSAVRARLSEGRLL